MNIRMPFLTMMTLLLSGVALAQDPQVSSANPATALQGTELDVEIAGSGFDNSAAVDFFVTGTTNPGGITVKKVKVRGSRKIVATIAIDAAAEVSNFDIEVRLSGNRTGKGTELFSVQSNDNPGQGANTAGVVTFYTNPLLDKGVFSDQVSTGNDQYVSFKLGTGDCATVVLPAQNGNDGGKAQLFVRDADGECTVSRKILVRGSGFDLNRINGLEAEELVERKLMCVDTFRHDTTIGDETNVLCQMFIEKIDEDGRVDRHFRFEWETAVALHVSDDERRVTASVAHVYEFVATKPNGRARKETIDHGTIPMALDVGFLRVFY